MMLRLAVSSLAAALSAGAVWRSRPRPPRAPHSARRAVRPRPGGAGHHRRCGGSGQGQGEGLPLGGFGGNAKEPIKIDADRLDVMDRENRAIFSGNVVAVQGESTIRCTVLTVVYERAAPGSGPKLPAAAGGQGNDAIKQIYCAGPVTVVSKEQVGTGDNAVFDRVANKIVMTGNVTLSQCQNVTTGDRLVYDLNSGWRTSNRPRRRRARAGCARSSFPAARNAGQSRAASPASPRAPPRPARAAPRRPRRRGPRRSPPAVPARRPTEPPRSPPAGRALTPIDRPA
jgi:lipopolysaccharide export system protein LptA